MHTTPRPVLPGIATPLAAVLTLLAVLAGLLGLTGSPAGAEQSSSVQRRVAAASVATGDRHTCVLTTGATVRCWGSGESGRLGYGNVLTIGDTEDPAVAGNVDLGGPAVAIAAGENHTCALLTRGRVRCWGEGSSGQLGYGATTDIGDNETPASAGNVPLGGKAVAITTGALHTCALLASGRTRCWGEGDDGRLGYGSTDDLGDDETPASIGDVAVGGRAVAVSAGAAHTCVVLRSRDVRCWGWGFGGRLGYASSDTIGDDEAPASAGDVTVGGPVVAVSAGGQHTCAVLTKGRLRCWGRGLHGRLGYASGVDVGDNETPASFGNVELEGKAMAVDAGGEHTCAVLTDQRLRCWGRGIFGQLGYGNEDTVGDDETPGSAGIVPVLELASAVSTGTTHSCALVGESFVRCWGEGTNGRLGYADTDDVGDNEPALDPGRVELGAPARLRAATSLSLNRTPKHDGSAPYAYRLSGRVKGAFVADGATCTGAVRVRVSRTTGPVVARGLGRLTDDCRYRVRIEVPGAKIPGGPSVRLDVRARFTGNPDLARATRTASVRAG